MPVQLDERFFQQLIMFLQQTDSKLNFIKTMLLKQNAENLNMLFDTVYETNMWGNGSGSGSKEELLRGYVAFVQDFVRTHNIHTIADVGCGDWQFSKNIDWGAASYTGYDVASFVIRQNRERYAKENINFVHYDGDFAQIQSADLLICKDVLQHLPNAKIHDFIAILPKFRYALIANDIGERVNADILPTQYRALDLRQPPFCLALDIAYLIKRMPREPDIAVMLYDSKAANSAPPPRRQIMRAA